MKQKKRKFIVVFILFSILTACGKEVGREEMHKETAKQEEAKAREAILLQRMEEDWYNSAEVFHLSLDEAQKEEIAQLLMKHQSKEAYSGELISKKLVDRLEEALYAYCKFGEDRSDRPYRDLLEELGAGSYRMTEEEIKKMFSGELPDQAFAIWLSDKKCLYLKCYFQENGGTSCFLWSKSEEGWFYKGRFTTMFSKGEVICDEDRYYYVGLEPSREESGENRENGIRIFRLDEQLEWENNLLIRYVPKDYKRVPLFPMGEGVEGAAADYIESLDAALVLKMEMDSCGSAEEIIEIIEEEEVPRVKKYSCADMMNTGVPIYMKKTYQWNHVYDWTYLEVGFYLYDETEGKFSLLENWDDSYADELRREYFWCEKIEEKVYTFQLFRSTDYTYLFEAFLYEGEQVTPLLKEVWVPQREMTYVEGDMTIPF